MVLENRLDIFKLRARFIQVIRDFFIQNEYLEVETPILSPFLLPEPSIEVFKTEYFDLNGNITLCYLIPSPELWMKRLISSGFGNIFQITKCFRNGEPEDKVHNPEFTMLEWYTKKASYIDSIKIMEELLSYIYEKINFKNTTKYLPPFKKISVRDAFKQFLNIDLDNFLKSSDMYKQAEDKGILMTDDDTPEQVFNKLFLNYVEPELPRTIPVILYDYPDTIPTFAKQKKETPYYERWELYIAGIEIANCYSEETDSSVIRNIIQQEERRKKTCRIKHKIDKQFPDILHKKYPECSGVALGIDRLFMSLAGITNIKKVIFFPFFDILV